MFTINLSPNSPDELRQFLDVIRESGFSLPSPIVSTPPRPAALVQAGTWESKWRESNPGARVPVFAKAMREKYGEKETFFKALLSGDETEGDQAESMEGMEEKGATYEPEGETLEPDAASLDY